MIGTSTLSQQTKKSRFWSSIPLAGAVMAFALAVMIFVGLLAGGSGVTREFRAAVQMPLWSGLVAAGMAACGVGLVLRRRGGYVGLLVLLPWAGLSLAGVFPRLLWDQDLPYTLVAFVVTAPLVFLMSRRKSMESLRPACDRNWYTRGGALLTLCVVAAVAGHIYVKAARPDGGGSLRALSEYGQRLAIVDVPLWNYVALLVAVSIPHRKSPGRPKPRPAWSSR